MSGGDAKQRRAPVCDKRASQFCLRVGILGHSAGFASVVLNVHHRDVMVVDPLHALPLVSAPFAPAPVIIPDILVVFIAVGLDTELECALRTFNRA